MNDQLVGIIVDFQLWKDYGAMRDAMWTRLCTAPSGGHCVLYSKTYEQACIKQSSLVVYR